MSIVVRELVIRARVEESKDASCRNGSAKSPREPETSGQDMERIVALCVEKVMETIERKKER